VVIAEKIERLHFFEGMAKKYLECDALSQYFSLNKLKKAEKIYIRIQRYYRNKDSMNNFLEEDANSLDYRNGLDEIDQVHSNNFFNYASLLLKKNEI